MKETTAEGFLQALKKAIDVMRNVVGMNAKVAGAVTAEERQAFEDGVKIVPPMVIRDAHGRSVPIPLAGPEPDWAKLKELLLKCPEPPREQLRIMLQELKSAPYVFRRSLSITAKQIPHALGGHPFSLDTHEERLAAAKRVERYRVKQHMSLAQAIAKTQKELSKEGIAISTKTLGRYYKEYVLGES
jgi:hypothetical protein